MQIERKKIIFVVPSLSGGGAEKVALTLLRAMRNSPGLDLMVVLFQKEATEFFGTDIAVNCIDAPEKNTLFGVAVKFIKTVLSLARIIRRESPCTIISFMEYANIVSIISNRLSGRKQRLIITVHAPPSLQFDRHGTDYRDMITGIFMKLLYRTADSIVAVSEHIRRNLIEKFSVAEASVHVIRNPVNLKEIVRLSAEKVDDDLFCGGFSIILSVGRLSKEKGGEYLLRAFSLIKGKTAAKLVMIGQGREEQNLKQLSIQLGIDKDLVFLGYRTNPYKYMKASTVFVLPSLYEGFGLALIEAMVCGTPVISTRSYEGIENIVEHEKTGLLVDVGDAEAMADAMLRLLNDSKLRRNMAAEAVKRTECFAVEKIVEQYKSILGLSS